MTEDIEGANMQKYMGANGEKYYELVVDGGKRARSGNGNYRGACVGKHLKHVTVLILASSERYLYPDSGLQGNPKTKEKAEEVDGTSQPRALATTPQKEIKWPS